MSGMFEINDSTSEVRSLARSHEPLIPTDEAHSEKPPRPTNSEKKTSRSSSSRRSSWVWEHFVIKDCGDMSERRGICKYCDEEIKCPPSYGTNSLNNHLLRCRKFDGSVKQKKQKTLELKSHSPTSHKFNQEECRGALVRMIIVDELPFRSVEREGLRHFCNIIAPQFHVPSRSTITRDCLRIYSEEKKNLMSFFSKLSSRICLTTDTWTSCQNLSYMCLTAHFVDTDWILHKKIINFRRISGHSGEVIGKAVENCLLEWGIEKVMTVTVDNASSNDVGVQYLRRRLNNWNGTILNGEYLHMRCAVHIMNLIVKEGLTEVDDCIFRIRSAVKYVRSSDTRSSRFKSCIEKEKIISKKLVSLDVETRWNSTYLMLEAAVKFEKAFDLLETIDAKYVDELTCSKNRGLPGHYDWEHARTLLPFLKVFYDATLKLSGSQYVTGNEYMQVMLGVGMILSRRCKSGDSHIQLMASKMKTKYDKYMTNIDNINVMLFVAIVFDPRYKMGYVNWLIDNSYNTENGKVLKEKVQQVLFSMFELYTSTTPLSNLQSSSQVYETNEFDVDAIENVEDLMTALYDQQHTHQKGLENKSELDKYLIEECEDRNNKSFQILSWWKLNCSRFRILSSMARDLLAMPTSTVASESAFSVGGRVLDPFRSSLTPKMVETLMCSQDWLRKSNLPLTIEESTEDLELLESELANTSEDHISISIDD